MQLRTPCREIKNITLNSTNNNFILPAATKEDITYILQDNMGFNPDILFITAHGDKTNILCEDNNGKCFLHHNDDDNTKYICDNNQLMSQEEFCSNLIKTTTIKLLFLNCCNMLDFANYVSKTFPQIYIICWNTDAEDVSCLEFQKKILDELNKNQGNKLKDTDLISVYENAAKSFIESCGNINRIKDPSTSTREELIKLRPTGLNCLIHNSNTISKLEHFISGAKVTEDDDVPELV